MIKAARKVGTGNLGDILRTISVYIEDKE